jgi:hypothetical protein
MQNQLDWNRLSSLSIDQFHGVDHLADIVYERLLTRPGMPLESYGRTFTLPDDFESKRPQRQLPSTPVKSALQSVVGTTEQRFLGQEEFANGEIFPQIEEGSDNTLADEINEYLLSMNLDELSEQDVEYLDQNTNVSPQLHIEGPPGESTGLPNQAYIDPSEQPQPSKPRESTTHEARFRSSKKSTNLPGLSALDGLGLAAGMISFVDVAAKISFNIMGAYHSRSGAPLELLALSRRVIQFSGLLKITAEVIRTAMPAGELQDMGWEVLKDSTEAMDEVQNILEKIKGKSSVRIMATVTSSLRWEFRKERVHQIIEDLESLTSTISVMLQLYQTHATERQFLATEQQLRAAEEHSKATFMMARERFDMMEGELKVRASVDANHSA